MFAFNFIYDEAVFYTNVEYQPLPSIKMDVQSFVEIELHLIGRRRSNDEQLGYVKTRR